MKISPVKQIKDGLVVNNPIFVQFLGMCSALAITTSITNAVGMGLSVTGGAHLLQCAYYRSCSDLSCLR